MAYYRLLGIFMHRPQASEGKGYWIVWLYCRALSNYKLIDLQSHEYKIKRKYRGKCRLHIP